MANDIPKLTPELFSEIIKTTSPVMINGPFPHPAGTTKSYTNDEPAKEGVEPLGSSLYVEHLRWFTLAPLYYSLGCSFNLCKDFSETREGRESHQLTVEAPFNITPTIKGWENIMQGMSVPHWEQFLYFLAGSVFQKSEKWWMISGQEFEILPEGKDKPFKLTVFSPVGADVGIYPWYDVKNKVIKFYQGGGDPLVNQHAAIYNSRAVPKEDIN